VVEAAGAVALWSAVAELEGVAVVAEEDGVAVVLLCAAELFASVVA
jgi:hypothetical protein